ncbi:MAG: autotransporter-associated beta strand repeat-containing protein, partial [Verrucomicrobiae bacterium]|nr:autotransporter-associated beta strand repeat-containing protein [Verrucomicrobiae bacterium]
ANNPGDPNIVTITDAFSPLVVHISNASGNPYTFTGSGKLTGGTLVSKTGTGIAKFANANNDFSGATTISGGAIIKQVADSTTGDINVTADNVSFVLDGGIADGAGQTVHIHGPGITGANYFFANSGGYRGALQSQNGNNTWEGDIALESTANGALTVNRVGVQSNASLTLTGNITENVTGAYLLFRAGNLGENITLAGPSTYSYTAETQMFSFGGSIILGSDNKLPTGILLNLTSGGSTVFDMNGFDQETAGIYGGATGLMATITNNGSGPSVLTSSPAVGISVTSNAFITDDGTNTVSFVKNGEGSQILGNANTYSGTTTVNAGILSINGDQTGATGAVQVSGGSLGGAGIIGGAVTVGALGILDPAYVVTAGATGTLTVDSANFSAGGTLAVDLNDANGQKADLLAVNNGLNVANAKLVFKVAGALAETSYTIASAGSITGTISPGDVTGLPAGYQLVHTATEIRLEQAAGYATWAAANAGGGTADQDHDNDGVENGVEYFLGETGSGFTTSPTSLTGPTATWTNGGNIPSGDYGSQFVIQTSGNLVDWTDVVDTDPNLDNQAGSVSYTLTGSGSRFMRLKVTPN